MIIQFIVSLFATLSFAELFGAPKKELFFCGLTGAIGWVVYVIGLNSNMGTVLANLTATFALTVLGIVFGFGLPQSWFNALQRIERKKTAL